MAGASRLHSLQLPRAAAPPTLPSEELPAAEPSAEIVTQGIKDLDLEFPPLLAAVAPATKGVPVELS